MTTAAGCTPEEAASAAARIAEIMTKHGMNDDRGDLSFLYRQRSAQEAIYRPPPAASMPLRGWIGVGLLFGALLLIMLIYR
ncbi:hypothetical protein ACRQ5Q_18560 [Bradyrhizobium sp. PMVTL-01]|uniref:hypothetical protein n=1 Tax=Bradyrhizobium sp. PMVTL-01 TaxID=3434999 RepID=UPI003F70E542